jgi:surfeit locus 1 family protein
MMADTGQRPRRFPVSMTVCTAVVLCVLVGLGSWQIHRLQWKEGLIAERAAAMAAPPLALSGAPGETVPEPFRRVSVSGQYLPGKAVLVGPRSYRQESGFHLIQPLRTDTGRIVLVDRGWVPHAAKERVQQPDPPPGRVTVEGLLRVPGGRGWLTPDNDPERGHWFTVDPEAMAYHLDLPGVMPWWVAAGPGPDPKRPPIGGLTAEALPNPHLHYAITWYSLAVTLLAVYVLVLRRRR